MQRGASVAGAVSRPPWERSGRAISLPGRMAAGAQPFYARSVQPRAERMPSRTDVLLAAAIAALLLLEIALESDFGGQRPAAIAGGAIFAAALAWRRTVPLLPLAVAMAAIEYSNLWTTALANTATFLLGTAIAIYSAGRWL